MQTNHPLHTRYAPTPSGYLHLGNVYNFIINRLLAKLSGGTTLLRIDDNDSARSNPVFLQDIFETLDFLGLDYETGPASIEDFQKNWSQLLRREDYDKALEQLANTSDLFACDCSRSQLAASGNQNKYNGHCQDLAIPLDQPEVAWRIKVPIWTKIEVNDKKLGKTKINIGQQPGSFVVRRKDGIAAYQICSLVDDLHFGINAIVRGSDLLESTALQIFLARRLELHSFSETNFWHHELLRNEQQQKLSKSTGSLSVKTLKDQGASVAFVYQTFAKWMGLQKFKNVQTFLELLRDIQESKNVNHWIFDPTKLQNPNNE